MKPHAFYGTYAETNPGLSGLGSVGCFHARPSFCQTTEHLRCPSGTLLLSKGKKL